MIGTNIHVFDAGLKAAIDKAERGDAEAMREVAAMRRAFYGELLLLPPKDKAVFRQALDAHDKRVASLKAKPAKAPQGPSTNDEMLRDTERIQAKTLKSLERTRARALEARDVGREVADRLADHGEQIMQIDRGLTDADADLRRTSQIMQSILDRMQSDKLIICFSMLFFAILIAAIVVVTVFKQHPAAASPHP